MDLKSDIRNIIYDALNSLNISFDKDDLLI